MHEIAGYVGGVLTTMCLLPQLVKIYYNKSAKDVSLWTFAVLLLGVLVWIVYGVLEEDNTIIATNVVSGVFTFGIVIGCVIYGSKESTLPIGGG